MLGFEMPLLEGGICSESPRCSISYITLRRVFHFDSYILLNTGLESWRPNYFGVIESWGPMPFPFGREPTTFGFSEVKSCQVIG